ncbi:hypothetical protein [Bradyrhizobium neotropicale]|uniref:DUF7940 domain-containing protein n=1 Tax=Bradyrhizobium neotropicale TaxID=1497615 RepID=UPI001AD63078|nr:hypothetical protein [Bradyrhizobium neotropicale]MBO4228005.1 hypothetical protein [Bradyrhizobium neotropicale]
MKLIDDWKTELHRLWSVRIALFMFVLNGALLGLAGFVDVLNPYLFLALNVFGYGLLGVVRLVKQKPKAEVQP